MNQTSSLVAPPFPSRTPRYLTCVVAGLLLLPGCQWLEKKAETEPGQERLSLDDDPSFQLPNSARSSTENSARLGGFSREAQAIEKRLGVTSR